MGIADYLEQKRREQVNRVRREDAKKVSLGLFLGALAGTTAGLLLAPKSGKETREDIVKATQNVADTLQKKTNEVASKAKDLYEEHIEGKLTSILPSKNEAEETKEEAKDKAEKVKENTKDATEEVKKAAKDVAEDVKKGAKNVSKEATK